MTDRPAILCTATLVAGAGVRLDIATLAAAAAALPNPDAPVWLDPGRAADLPFAAAPNADHRTFAEAVRAALGGAPIDVLVQPAAGRAKRLLLADMDSTMIGQECVDELADYAGFKPEVAAITERAMRGEIAFEPALRARVALLKGLPVGIVDEIMATRLTLSPGAEALVSTMRARGAYTCLVSGGFTLFTSRIAARLGFDEHRANTLIVADGRFTGEVAEPILGREAKRAALEELRAAHGLAPEETLAIGDGANDLAMLGAAGLGLAYRAKPAVAAAAHGRIDHAGLDAALFAQGYARAEVAA